MVSKFLQAAVTASQCLQLLKSCAGHGNGLGTELSCWGAPAGQDRAGQVG